MTQSKKPRFTIPNQHVIQGSQPPTVDGDERKTYHSYFENRHGDQSIFIYRRETDEAVVYSSDADWNAFPVVEGKVVGLVLSPDESVWLQACLQAIGKM